MAFLKGLPATARGVVLLPFARLGGRPSSNSASAAADCASSASGSAAADNSVSGLAIARCLREYRSLRSRARLTSMRAAATGSPAVLLTASPVVSATRSATAVGVREIMFPQGFRRRGALQLRGRELIFLNGLWVYRTATAVGDNWRPFRFAPAPPAPPTLAPPPLAPPTLPPIHFWLQSLPACIRQAPHSMSTGTICFHGDADDIGK